MAVADTASSSGADVCKADAVVHKAPQKINRILRRIAQVPENILHDSRLNSDLAALPANYNFEVHKTIWRIKRVKARKVALQFPEGLMMYACTISDILERWPFHPIQFRPNVIPGYSVKKQPTTALGEIAARVFRFADVEFCYIMGDVTYGACCVDDYSAAALSVDLLIHYGHSCLVPVDATSLVPCFYVFVDIRIDVQHLIETVRLNFQRDQQLSMAGTIQFSSALQIAARDLLTDFPALGIPQSKPLSPGEVLGCTAPTVTHQADAIVFVADGRFHMEAMMIANPGIPVFRYDPYARVMTKETYDHHGMQAARRAAIEAAQNCQSWGLILGTLGRQGNPRTLNVLQAALEETGRRFALVLLSEVTPQKLRLMEHVEAWVQIACPRLSIDWGEFYDKPVLTPYEGLVALGKVEGFWMESGGVPRAGKQQYPMDYYARDGGAWSSTWHKYS